MIILLLLFTTASLNALFEYDRALSSAHNGQWKESSQALANVLVDHPDNASLLYDLGVASYRADDIKEADAYFNRVTQLKEAPKTLREKAFFNRGNAKVKQQELHKAIEQYEQALQLNPDNEQARANCSYVKQMVEQEEQQEQSSKSNQQNESSETELQDSDQSEQKQMDSSEDSSKTDDVQTYEKSTKDQLEELEQESSEQSDEQENGDKERIDENKKQEEGEEDGDEEQESGSDHDSKWSKDDQAESAPDDKEQDQGSNGRGNEEHTTPLMQESSQSALLPEDKDGEDDNQEVAQSLSDDSYENVDEWVADILRKREQADNDLNKKMIRATVNEAVRGSVHDKHCW